MRRRLGSLVTAGIQIGVCLWLSLWLHQVQADPPRVGEFQLSIKVLQSHDETGQDQQDQQPLADMFVYAPQTGDAGARRNLSSSNRPGFKGWLVAVAEQTTESSAEHKFYVQDGRVIPSRVAGRTTDTWIIPKRIGESLWIETIENSPAVGVSHTEARLTLARPEPTAIRILPSIGNAEPAYALVLDHPVSKITDDNGIAVFTGLPVGVDIPLFVFFPGLKRISLLENVADVEIRGRRIVVCAKESKEMAISILALLVRD